MAKVEFLKGADPEPTLQAEALELRGEQLLEYYQEKSTGNGKRERENRGKERIDIFWLLTLHQFSRQRFVAEVPSPLADETRGYTAEQELAHVSLTPFLRRKVHEPKRQLMRNIRNTASSKGDLKVGKTSVSHVLKAVLIRKQDTVYSH